MCPSIHITCVLAFLHDKIDAITLSELSQYLLRKKVQVKNCSACISLYMCMCLLVLAYVKYINYLILLVAKSKIILDAQLCHFFTQWIKPGSWWNSGFFCWHKYFSSFVELKGWQILSRGFCELLNNVTQRKSISISSQESCMVLSASGSRFSWSVATVGNYKKRDSVVISSWNIAITSR